MRALLLLLATAVLAGCGATPGAAVAVIPSSPDPTSASASAPPSDTAAPAPRRISHWAGIDRVKEALRVSGGGRQTIALEAKGHLLVTDLHDQVENELQLEDIDHVVYSAERGRPYPHCVQMWLKRTPGVMDRYRWRKIGSEEWNQATSSYQPLCVDDKQAADDMVDALKLLLSR
jgi:hypothetical protein